MKFEGNFGGALFLEGCREGLAEIGALVSDVAVGARFTIARSKPRRNCSFAIIGLGRGVAVEFPTLTDSVGLAGVGADVGSPSVLRSDSIGDWTFASSLVPTGSST